MDQVTTGIAVQMTVLQGENLVKLTTKQPFLSFVRAEFNGMALGDLQKLQGACGRNGELYTSPVALNA